MFHAHVRMGKDQARRESGICLAFDVKCTGCSAHACCTSKDQALIEYGPIQTRMDQFASFYKRSAKIKSKRVARVLQALNDGLDADMLADDIPAPKPRKKTTASKADDEDGKKRKRVAKQGVGKQKAGRKRRKKGEMQEEEEEDGGCMDDAEGGGHEVFGEVVRAGGCEGVEPGEGEEGGKEIHLHGENRDQEGDDDDEDDNDDEAHEQDEEDADELRLAMEFSMQPSSKLSSRPKSFSVQASQSSVLLGSSSGNGIVEQAISDALGEEGDDDEDDDEFQQVR